MKGQDVYVVGAGNSAGQAVVHLSKYASRATLLARGDSLTKSMSEYLIKQIEATENIEVCLNTRIIDGGGKGRLEHLVLEDSLSGHTETVPAAGLFVLIGAQPHTGWLPEEIERDKKGFVFTGRDLPSYGRAHHGWHLGRLPLPTKTSIPGVFVVGDHGLFRGGETWGMVVCGAIRCSFGRGTAVRWPPFYPISNPCNTHLEVRDDEIVREVSVETWDE